MKRILSAFLMLLLIGSFAELAGLAQRGPQGVIVVPPSEFQIRVRTDKPAYQVGSKARVFFDVNQEAYVYILDIDAAGTVTQIFPNAFSQNNFVSAGEHVLPDRSTYDLLVVPPLGQEVIMAIASKEPLTLVQGFPQSFPRLGTNPEEVRQRILGIIQGLIPSGRVTTDFITFQVTAGPPGTLFGELFVSSDPSGAEIFIDDSFKGFTPKRFFAEAGIRRLLLKKSGFQDNFQIISLAPDEFKNIFVRLQTGGPGINNPPVARFTFSPANPAVGQTVFFDASSSFDPDPGDFITQFQWDFDSNGTIDASGQFVSNSFFVAGLHQVTLIVTDTRGASGSTTQTVQVGQPGFNQPPIARFTFSPTNPAVGQTVFFDASASFDPDGFIVQYLWDFNSDGSFDASGRTATNTIFFAGAHLVTLRVIDNQGAAGTTSQQVFVGGAPPPPFFGQAGFFINAVALNKFSIRVQGRSDWAFQDHRFRIFLETNGRFTSLEQQVIGNATPLGLLPVPSGNTLELNGIVRDGAILYIIGISSSTTAIKFDLRLDTDGDGNLERRTDFVFIGDQLKRPPSNPFVLKFQAGTLIPFIEIQICIVLVDQPGFQFIICFRFRDL